MTALPDFPAPARVQTGAYSFRFSHLPLYFILTVGAIFAATPFLYMLTTSLMTLGETINRRVLPASPQLGNYAQAWVQGGFDHYFVNSVIISAITIVGLVTTSALAAYAFARMTFPGQNAVFLVLLATLMIPETVTFIPNFLIVRGSVLPLPGGSWLDTLTALTVPFMANAFSIFLLRQFFARIPGELWDAAQLDGAGHLRFLTSVVLPMSRAPVLTVTLLTFVASWNSFLWPLLVTFTPKWRPLTVGLWSFISEAGPQTQLLMAGSVIAIVPVLAIYLLTQRHFTEGVATSGLKG
ncbi:carbohydrate ABC transporter permease [Deinococcus sp.]|uniref:carbohydrate ABC transporter permease n=1 Tax=Deinococcus sp. TaxID=47478 RepID=UPI003C7D4CF2